MTKINASIGLHRDNAITYTGVIDIYNI